MESLAVESSMEGSPEWDPGEAGAGDAALPDSFDTLPVVAVEIARLRLGGSPRLSGEDEAHARMLADVRDELPPIIVHKQTGQVIDGRHRVRAAQLNGRRFIMARIVDCDASVAFALSVRENVTHGLPLSLADRRAAAAEIVQSNALWSDRAVAACAGLSDKTVSAIRSGLGGPRAGGLPGRFGRDGRFRPLNSATQRRQAAALIQDDASLGLREVARRTGLSPATVRDVRRRLFEGRDPVPARYSESGTRQDDVVRRAGVSTAEPVDRGALLTKLAGDPLLKSSQRGRDVLRWLHRYTVNEESPEVVAPRVPDHWARAVANLARSCAQCWEQLAERLEQRVEN